jgi:hypothetical protein
MQFRILNMAIIARGYTLVVFALGGDNFVST